MAFAPTTQNAALIQPTKPTQLSRGRSSRIGSRRINLLYVPALAVFALVTVYPLISGVQYSLTNWNGYSAEKTFTGLDNFIRLFQDSVFATALLNTFIYGVGSTLVQQILGLGLAVVLDKPVRGRGLARAVIYLPVLVSPIIMGTMYYLLLSYSNGGLNDIALLFGGTRIAWLSSAQTAIVIILLVNSLQFVGVSMVIYLAGLQSIPVSYREAAMLDGATGWRQFTHITVPLLQPAFATSVVLNLIGGLKLFDVIEVLTGGGPGYASNSVSTLISKSYFDSQSAGYASAMGIVLFLIIAILTLSLNTAFNRKRIDL